MNTIHMALDIETLSTRPTAAIISIAAKCFNFSDSEEPMPLGLYLSKHPSHTGIRIIRIGK